MCSEKNNGESVVRTFKNICTVAVGILGKIDKKTFVTLSKFWLLRGWELWVNPLKKENLLQKSFSDNHE